MASQTEIGLYLKRARLALAQSRDNLKQFVDRAAVYLRGEGHA